MSKAEEPSSTRPRRLLAPAAKRSASATVVLPAPPCPTTATLRSLVTSSAGIPSSVTLVHDAEPVEGQELVDGLDGGGDRGDERGEAAGGEGAGLRVVLLADALDHPVHQRGVAVRPPRLDRVHGRHDARDGDPGDVLGRGAARAEEAEQHHAVLVRGALGLGLQAPVARQAVAVVDPDLGVRVADVDREQHRPYVRYPPGTVTSPASTRTTPPSGRRSRSAPSSSRPSTRPASSPSGEATRTSAPVSTEYDSHSARTLENPLATKRP